MNKTWRLVIFCLVVLSVFIFFLYQRHPEVLRRIMPNRYCGQFSGFEHPGWASSKVEICQKAGCGYVVTKQYKADPDVVGLPGFEFNCISK